MENWAREIRSLRSLDMLIMAVGWGSVV